MLCLGILICTANIVAANYFNFLDEEFPFHRRVKEQISDQEEYGNLENKLSVCRTKECFKLASDFWESMNKSVDPCEDFYEYACGGWSTSNPVPPTEMSWGTFNIVRKELNLRIRDLLERPIKKEDILPIKQIKKFYWSCMDVDALEKAGIKPIEAILSRNGGWPIAMEPQEWNNEEFTWQQIDSYYTRLVFFPAFFSLINADSFLESLDNSDKESKEFKISSEESEEDENVLVDFIGISPPELSPIVKMPQRMRFNRTNMYLDVSYAKLISQVASIFARERGANVDEKQINDDVKDIIEFEKMLYEDDASDDTQFEGSMKEFQDYYDSLLNNRSVSSKINWKATINNLFSEANIELNGTEPIVVQSSTQLKKLVKLLETTNARTIVNYVHWNFISRMIEFTNTKMETILFEINKKHVGIREIKPRWERCMENVDLKHAVSYQFIKTFFKDKMEDEARKIFESIQNEIIKHIIKSDWLDDKSRKMALEKIKVMSANIGYPKWYKNETALLNHYRGVIIGQNFLDNKISYRRFSYNRNLRTSEMSLFSKPDFWLTHPTVVNAYYNPIFNSLTITAADFLSPFYSPNRPETINYGFLGTIIGHEMSHGFDNDGILYDGNGASADWSKMMEKKILSKTGCFSRQYVQFYKNTTDLATLMDDSKITLGENMADSMGLRMMFGALQENEKEKNYPRLPGFVELSGEQSFFLSYAKLWCINTTPEYEKLKQMDSHSEGRYRVISAVQNSDGFAKAYNCPKNSPMNPEIKCTICVSIVAAATANFLNWKEFLGPHHKKTKNSFSKNEDTKDSKKVCRTQECFKIAAEFWESMNKSIDPCEDFYEYSCGSFKKYHPMPPNEKIWSPFRKMQKEVNDKIRDILEVNIHPDDLLPVKKVKKFYQSCMNTDAVKKLGIEPLEAILGQNGGWPIIMEQGEWNPEEFSWKQIHDYYSQTANIFPLYSISVGSDFQEIRSGEKTFKIKEQIKVIKLKLPDLPLLVDKSDDKDEMYTDGTYAKFIVDVAKIFARKREAHVNEEQLKKDAEDIIKMEKLISDHSIYKNSSIVQLTLAELQKYYDKEKHQTHSSKINWKKTMTDLFSLANVQLDKNEIISVIPIKFLKKLSNILDEMSPRTIVNYIHWHFLSNMLPLTISEIQELEYKITKKQDGVKEETPRWRTCVRNVKMKDAISYMFVKKYFQEKMKIDTEKVVSSIQNEMAKHILKADWIDDSVRKDVIKKLKHMKHNIGYPDWYNNETAFNNYYRGLPVGQDFFSNNLSYEKFSLKKDLRSLRSKPKPNVWFLQPIVVNAVYLRNANSMTIPAADFQLPFYTMEPIETINYGALGMVVAHEISHGFDESGIAYDSKGEKIALPKNIKEAYETKAKCFVKQFNDLNPNIKIESDESDIMEEDIGKMKLDENIADTLGIDTSFDVFEILDKEKKQPKLPGFENFNNEQLFFLSFAKLYCENVTPEFESMSIKYDTHGSGRYRVTASLQNSEGFSKAFNCPVGSLMNPRNKCKLWK